MGVRPRINDLVIVLPGITGSVLVRDGRDIWAPSSQAVWGALRSGGASLTDLQLDAIDDPELDDLGDGVVADRLVGTAHLLPGVAKIDGYTGLVDMITNHFEVMPGRRDDPAPANFYAFPYDWRRDIRVAARRLARFVSDRLAVWRRYTGNPNAKTILLAHSMGGLVARFYLEVLDGHLDARALVTFGTPYRGAPQALEPLVNGIRKGPLDLSSMIRSFTSVYQLLPIYQCIDTGTHWRRITELTGRLGIDDSRVSAARQVHDEILERVDARTADSYVTLPFLGFRQPTTESATLIDGTFTTHRSTPSWIDPRLGGGDGTVPMVSAIPVELSDELQDTYVAARHSSLHVAGQVLDDLEQRLRRMTATGLGAIRGPSAIARGVGPTISLDVGDLYLVGEPIRVGIVVDDASARPSVTVERLDGGTVAVAAEVAVDGDGWVAMIDWLDAGVHRISVSAPGVPAAPVSDVIEVLG